MSLPDRALQTVRTHQMFARGARVLIALSGGPDSVALVHILRELEARGELAVAGVGHFNHQLRGQDADADERFCIELAADLSLPIEIGRADVRAAARASRRSLESEARSLRYGFLAEAASRLQADVVAVGQTRDDQAETFLLRLLRGAGTRGLGGIRPRAGNLVRPLLEVSRDELRQYAAAHGLQYRLDASNEDTRIPRNRIRHDLIPHLKAYSPAIVEILAREATLAREDEEYLERAAIESAGSVVLEKESGTVIDVDQLGRLPAALASRVVRQALTARAGGRFIGFQHIERVLALAAGSAGGGLTLALPGQVAERRGPTIVLGSAAEAPFSNFFRFPLSIPGEVALGAWAVSAQEVQPASWSDRPRSRGGTVLVAAPPLHLPLAVRTRKRGDRFHPLGMGGRGRKLQDFLVDRKVARAERDRLPLVVDRDDRIVWVVGQGVAEDFRVTEPSQGVILLKARRLGGVG
jgi:tRNA(Ile)-lysidine synthase